MRFFIVSLLIPVLVTCKSKPQLNESGVSTDGNVVCAESEVQQWIKEILAIEPQLVSSERYHRNAAVGGNCTVAQTLCEDKCHSDFWGLTKVWYQKEYALCINQCGDLYVNCMNRAKDAPKDSDISLEETQRNRLKNLQRREELLSRLHECTSTYDQQYTRGQNLQQLGHAEQEWKALSEIWKSYSKRDPLVYLTFRFSGATFIDVPARRSTQSLAQWKRGYEADPFMSRMGLRLGDVAMDGLDYFISGADYVFRAGIPDNKFTTYLSDYDGMAAASMQINKIVKSCRNVKNVCTAISCLGHRTQEVLMIRENLDNINNLQGTPDDRQVAVCRHYAPTFMEACNIWAKKNGFANKIQCGNTGKISLMHAWPTIQIKAADKTYEYIYDILNDPFAPDLIPVNSNAISSPSIPCE